MYIYIYHRDFLVWANPPVYFLMDSVCVTVFRQYIIMLPFNSAFSWLYSKYIQFS